MDKAGAAFSKPWSLVVCSGVFLDIARLMGMWLGPRRGGGGGGVISGGSGCGMWVAEPEF